MTLACGKPKIPLPPPPVRIGVEGQASPTINRDANGDPLSVVVRIYHLKGKVEFPRLTFDMVTSGRTDQELLGADFLGRSEYVVVPGATTRDATGLAPGTKYVGIVAFFRKPDPNYWRYLVSLDQLKLAQSKKEWQGQKLPLFCFTVQDCFLVMNYSTRKGPMVIVNKEGHLIDPRIRIRICPLIEHGDLEIVHGIVIHQTDGASAQSALDQYHRGGAGAHFLLDKDGTIFQTASIFKVTWNVGKIKSRCVAEHRCTPVELSKLQKMTPSQISRMQWKKPYPMRFPSNQDSIGIELVGQAFPVDRNIKADQKAFEAVSQEQNISLTWLVQALSECLKVPMTEIFRHPEDSWKNITEASTAKW